MSAVREFALGDRQVSIVRQVEANPVMVLVDEKAFDDFYSEIERECSAFVPDLSTVTSRKEIASLAYKVARTKTAIDKAGKDLNEEARKKINVVDASRRKIRDRLDALAETVRKPLTEWEEYEKARVEKHEAMIADIEIAAIVAPEDTTHTIGSRLDMLRKISVESFDEFKLKAEAARKAGVAVLEANLARIEKEEADRAELARLRAEAAERDRIEQGRIAAEQVERENAEAAKREAERLAAAEEAEKQRIAAAEERARREAAEAAERTHREAQARHAAELQRIEDERAAERQKIEREAAEKAAVEKADREAAEARQRDRDHRSKIMTAAKEAIIEAGTVSEAKAKLIVSAIAAGSVPNVTLQF